MRSTYHKLLIVLVVLLTCTSAWAGGAWVPKPGKGYLQFGYSRKTADQVWDANGEDLVLRNAAGYTHQHDFRYGYFTGEVGVVNRVSATFLMTYLWGYEGFENVGLEENFGLSDAWFGAKFRLIEGQWPMALRATVRTPFFYDQDGPYVRHLYNTEPYRNPGGGPVVLDSTFLVLNNPEWRGLLKHDFTVSYSLGHSFQKFAGWTSLEAGFTWRQGAPANEIPLSAEFGYGLPFKSFSPFVKVSLLGVFSIHNNSAPDAEDRFNFPPNAPYDFNDASMLRGSVSLILPAFGAWNAEIGYGQWLWGRGARQYKEPFISFFYDL